MMDVSSLKNFLTLEKLYTFTLIMTGIIFFIFHIEPSVQLQEWIFIYFLSITIVVLSHWTIISPQGEHFSTDSCIYLFSIVALGLNVTLHIVLLVFIYDFILGKRSRGKDLLNFSSYSLMIIASYFMFITVGGSVGPFNTGDLFPYALAMITYAVLNIVTIAIYLSILQQEKLYKIFKKMLKDVVSTYIIVLLLSIILNILISAQGFFGLFIFLSVCLLLSTIFKKYFDLYQSIYEKANKDHLTDLYNHGYFKQLMQEQVEVSKKKNEIFSIAMLDLDDFKKYNDSFGHLKGDKLLKFFGSLLEAHCAEKQFIVARYGGEEFVILMPDTNEREAYRFLNSVRKKINDTYFEGVEVLPYGCLSFSGGITESGELVYNTNDLISKADEAMYYAKAQGKNNIHIYAYNSSVQKSINMESELEALEQHLQIFLSKNIYTYRHSKRVFRYANEFCNVFPLSEEEKKNLVMGALIHDIGKLEVPRDIINKKGKLDAYEWEIIKKHTKWGKEILSIHKKYDPLLPLVELHHERYDGKGYPYGLDKNNIPKLARILCIIDSFDAMTTERPYQRTKTYEEAFKELRECAGKQFDPSMVEPFITMVQDTFMDKKADVVIALDADDQTGPITADTQ